MTDRRRPRALVVAVERRHLGAHCARGAARVVHGGADLHDHRGDLRRGTAPVVAGGGRVRCPRGDRHALDPLHREKRLAAAGIHADGRHDVGMGQRRRRLVVDRRARCNTINSLLFKLLLAYYNVS